MFGHATRKKSKNATDSCSPNHEEQMWQTCMSSECESKDFSILKIEDYVSDVVTVDLRDDPMKFRYRPTDIF